MFRGVFYLYKIDKLFVNLQKFFAYKRKLILAIKKDYFRKNMRFSTPALEPVTESKQALDLRALRPLVILKTNKLLL